jgi:hypothetical protein
MRIRVRIYPPHPLVCHKKAIEWGGPSDQKKKKKIKINIKKRTKTKMWHDIKIPHCSKALSAEHRPKFCSLSPAMMTPPYM